MQLIAFLRIDLRIILIWSQFSLQSELFILAMHILTLGSSLFNYQFKCEFSDYLFFSIQHLSIKQKQQISIRGIEIYIFE